jgi:GDP/GTP exchange factor required for growth at low temperature
MYNFQTVTQIIHALQLPAIERLKKTWSKVPSFEMRLFSQLKFFCSPLRDFRLLREAISTLSSQWGPPGQEPREADFTLPGVPGALPFFGKWKQLAILSDLSDFEWFSGLILRDLAISSELPTFLDPSDPRAPALINEETMLLPQYADPTEFSDYPPLPEGIPLRPLINIHKYRIVARTIQLVMTFKELAETYPYEPELPLYRKCLTLQCLPMQKITELSHACEK